MPVSCARWRNEHGHEYMPMPPDMTSAPHPPSGHPLFWKAFLTSILLCGLFFLAYGGTNTLAAHRGVTRAMYFDWERYIPFVPLMIVPYMSIDLFFFFAP